MQRFLLIIILALALLLIDTEAPRAAAQIQIMPAPFALNATPSAPSAGETFAIEASTPTTDRNTLIFNWRVNGVSRSDLSGYGKNRILLIAGQVGAITRVSVTATRGSATVGSASTDVRTVNLSLPWTAETYVPKWYQGKALPVAKSVVRISAIPEVVIAGRVIPPENLIYRWSFDDEKDALVGVGEQVFPIRMKDITGSTHQILVVVEDLNKQIHKEAGLLFTSTIPDGAVYPSTPSGGIEYRASAKTFAPPTRGVFDFQFEPFFFPVTSRSELTYQWRIGSTPATGVPENPSILTVDTTTEAQGQVSISVTANDNDNLIPGVFASFLLLLP